MRVFYLEDIRKSFHFVYYQAFQTPNHTKDIFVYNSKIRDTKSYLSDLKAAFPQASFVEQSLFIPERHIQHELYLNHTTYSSESLAFLKSLNWAKKLMFLSNNVGLKDQDKAALAISPDEYIIWNAAFIYHLLKARKSILLEHQDKFRFIDFIENKSLIEHKKIDTLIFAPTRMCFEREHSITSFLFNMRDYLKSIPEQEEVYFKPHQGIKENYLETNKVYIKIIVSFLSVLHYSFLSAAASFFKQSNSLVKIINYTLFKKIKYSHRFKSLEFPLIPIEFYIPLVKTSLVGGFSNTLITAAYLNKEVNLLGLKRIPKSVIKRGANIDSAKFLKLNMKFFFDTTENQYNFSKNSFYPKNANNENS